mmetsp:Transcript_833/g.1163  ORF Transcript_833/g.1163 Transcript_833/m.1163 type:complete len:85 (-) Transcript_833:977-1231(-)
MLYRSVACLTEYSCISVIIGIEGIRTKAREKPDEIASKHGDSPFARHEQHAAPSKDSHERVDRRAQLIPVLSDSNIFMVSRKRR